MAAIFKNMVSTKTRLKFFRTLRINEGFFLSNHNSFLNFDRILETLLSKTLRSRVGSVRPKVLQMLSFSLRFG
jgi:hypothetical protein